MKKTIAAGLACAAALHIAAACAESGEMWEITSKTTLSNIKQVLPVSKLQVCLPKGSAINPRNVTPNRGCKITDVKTRGSKTTWKVSCGHNGTTLSGSGEIIAGPVSYHGVMRLDSASNGQTIRMTTYFQGRNLGKSCNALQPSRRYGKPLTLTQREPGESVSPNKTSAIVPGEVLAQDAAN